MDAGGLLESIWIAPVATARPHAVERAIAVAGRGLEGDRYAAGIGTFNPVATASSRDVSLIDAAAVEHLRAATGAELEPGDLRRNLVISGLELPGLIGARLRVGTVLLEVTGTCPPCGHLDRLVGLETTTHLAGRGGMRAAILEGGELNAGAPIAIERPARRLP